MHLLKIPALAFPVLCLWLLTRCFNTKPSGDGDSTPENQEKEDEGGIATFERKDDKSETADPTETGQTPVQLPGSNTGEACEENGTSVIIDKIADAGDELNFDYQIYGSESSALIVIQFSHYQKNEVSEIYIAKDNGQLVAQRGISETSDVNDDGSIKILNFDHIQIKEGEKLLLLFKTIQIQFLKKEFSEPVAFQTRFRDLPVTGPGTPDFSNLDYYDRHPGNAFSPDEKLYSLEKDPEAILKASFDAKYLTHEDYSGSVITDLMGNVVSDHGENFNALNDNTQFIVYRLMERKYWFRTFIRIC